MDRQRDFLSTVRRAAHGASGGAADLYDDVCHAAVDADASSAYVYATRDGDESRPDVLAAAGTGEPAPPASPPPDGEVEAVDGPSGGELHVPLTDGDDRHGTLAFSTGPDEDDAVDGDSGGGEPLDWADTGPLLDLGGTVALAAGKLEAEAARDDLDAELAVERRQFRKLHSIAAQMVSCEEEQSIYHLAIDAAENILEFDICGIDVARDGHLVPVALSTGMTADDSERIPDDEGVAGYTYQNDERVIVDDVADYDDAEPANDDYRSVLSVPIRNVGVFQAAAEREGAFTDRDAELAELLMSHVGETLGRLWSDQALRESEQKYRTLIEQSHDAVTIHREDDGYQFVNSRGTELFGRSEDDILSSSARDVVHPDDHGKLARLDGTTAAVGDSETFEARVRRPDGTVRHCEFSTTVITYQDEPAVLASIRDITERKERERELKRQNERLDRFAGVVSHDLRSPLNVAEGSLELAAETGGDEEHLERAGDALERMHSLVEDVLSLARQGRLVDETERVALDEVAADAWGSVDAPGATLDDGDAAGVHVNADPSRLRELFENLFRNAVEHGGDAVAVRVGALPGGGFYVEDDGPGIPEGDHEAVFERGVTSTEDGTGFGLAIVREIAEAHDWRVEAVPTDDGDDRGARFEVTDVATFD